MGNCCERQSYQVESWIEPQWSGTRVKRRSQKGKIETGSQARLTAEQCEILRQTWAYTLSTVEQRMHIGIMILVRFLDKCPHVARDFLVAKGARRLTFECIRQDGVAIAIAVMIVTLLTNAIHGYPNLAAIRSNMNRLGFDMGNRGMFAKDAPAFVNSLLQVVSTQLKNSQEFAVKTQGAWQAAVMVMVPLIQEGVKRGIISHNERGIDVPGMAQIMETSEHDDNLNSKETVMSTVQYTASNEGKNDAVALEWLQASSTFEFTDIPLDGDDDNDRVQHVVKQTKNVSTFKTAKNSTETFGIEVKSNSNSDDTSDSSSEVDTSKLSQRDIPSLPKSGNKTRSEIDGSARQDDITDISNIDVFFPDMSRDADIKALFPKGEGGINTSSCMTEKKLTSTQYGGDIGGGHATVTTEFNVSESGPSTQSASARIKNSSDQVITAGSSYDRTVSSQVGVTESASRDDTRSSETSSDSETQTQHEQNILETSTKAVANKAAPPTTSSVTQHTETTTITQSLTQGHTTTTGGTIQVSNALSNTSLMEPNNTNINRSGDHTTGQTTQSVQSETITTTGDKGQVKYTSKRIDNMVAVSPNDGTIETTSHTIDASKDSNFEVTKGSVTTHKGGDGVDRPTTKQNKDESSSSSGSSSDDYSDEEIRRRVTVKAGKAVIERRVPTDKTYNEVVRNNESVVAEHTTMHSGSTGRGSLKSTTGGTERKTEVQKITSSASQFKPNDHVRGNTSTNKYSEDSVSITTDQTTIQSSSGGDGSLKNMHGGTERKTTMREITTSRSINDGLVLTASSQFKSNNQVSGNITTNKDSEDSKSMVTEHITIQSDSAGEGLLKGMSETERKNTMQKVTSSMTSDGGLVTKANSQFKPNDQVSGSATTNKYSEVSESMVTEHITIQSDSVEGASLKGMTGETECKNTIQKIKSSMTTDDGLVTKASSQFKPNDQVSGTTNKDSEDRESIVAGQTTIQHASAEGRTLESMTGGIERKTTVQKITTTNLTEVGFIPSDHGIDMKASSQFSISPNGEVCGTTTDKNFPTNNADTHFKTESHVVDGARNTSINANEAASTCGVKYQPSDTKTCVKTERAASESIFNQMTVHTGGSNTKLYTKRTHISSSKLDGREDINVTKPIESISSSSDETSSEDDIEKEMLIQEEASIRLSSSPVSKRSSTAATISNDTQNRTSKVVDDIHLDGDGGQCETIVSKTSHVTISQRAGANAYDAGNHKERVSVHVDDITADDDNTEERVTVHVESNNTVDVNSGRMDSDSDTVDGKFATKIASTVSQVSSSTKNRSRSGTATPTERPYLTESTLHAQKEGGLQHTRTSSDSDSESGTTDEEDKEQDTSELPQSHTREHHLSGSSSKESGSSSSSDVESGNQEPAENEGVAIHDEAISEGREGKCGKTERVIVGATSVGILKKGTNNARQHAEMRLKNDEKDQEDVNEVNTIAKEITESTEFKHKRLGDRSVIQGIGGDVRSVQDSRRSKDGDEVDNASIDIKKEALSVSGSNSSTHGDYIVTPDEGEVDISDSDSNKSNVGSDEECAAQDQEEKNRSTTESNSSSDESESEDKERSESDVSDNEIQDTVDSSGNRWETRSSRVVVEKGISNSSAANDKPIISLSHKADHMNRDDANAILSTNTISFGSDVMNDARNVTERHVVSSNRVERKSDDIHIDKPNNVTEDGDKSDSESVSSDETASVNDFDTDVFREFRKEMAHNSDVAPSRLKRGRIAVTSRVGAGESEATRNVYENIDVTKGDAAQTIRTTRQINTTHVRYGGIEIGSGDNIGDTAGAMEDGDKEDTGSVSYRRKQHRTGSYSNSSSRNSSDSETNHNENVTKDNKAHSMRITREIHTKRVRSSGKELGTSRNNIAETVGAIENVDDVDIGRVSHRRVRHRTGSSKRSSGDSSDTERNRKDNENDEVTKDDLAKSIRTNKQTHTTHIRSSKKGETSIHNIGGSDEAIEDVDDVDIGIVSYRRERQRTVSSSSRSSNSDDTEKNRNVNENDKTQNIRTTREVFTTRVRSSEKEGTSRDIISDTAGVMEDVDDVDVGSVSYRRHSTGSSSSSHSSGTEAKRNVNKNVDLTKDDNAKTIRTTREINTTRVRSAAKGDTSRDTTVKSDRAIDGDDDVDISRITYREERQKTASSNRRSDSSISDNESETRIQDVTNDVIHVERPVISNDDVEPVKVTERHIEAHIVKLSGDEAGNSVVNERTANLNDRFATRNVYTQNVVKDTECDGNFAKVQLGLVGNKNGDKVYFEESGIPTIDTQEKQYISCNEDSGNMSKNTVVTEVVPLSDNIDGNVQSSSKELTTLNNQAVFKSDLSGSPTFSNDGGLRVHSGSDGNFPMASRLSEKRNERSVNIQGEHALVDNEAGGYHITTYTVESSGNSNVEDDALSEGKNVHSEMTRLQKTNDAIASEFSSVQKNATTSHVVTTVGRSSSSKLDENSPDASNFVFETRSIRFPSSREEHGLFDSKASRHVEYSLGPSGNDGSSGDVSTTVEEMDDPSRTRSIVKTTKVINSNAVVIPQDGAYNQFVTSVEGSFTSRDMNDLELANGMFANKNIHFSTRSEGQELADSKTSPGHRERLIKSFRTHTTSGDALEQGDVTGARIVRGTTIENADIFKGGPNTKVVTMVTKQFTSGDTNSPGFAANVFQTRGIHIGLNGDNIDVVDDKENETSGEVSKISSSQQDATNDVSVTTVEQMTPSVTVVKGERQSDNTTNVIGMNVGGVHQGHARSQTVTTVEQQSPSSFTEFEENSPLGAQHSELTTNVHQGGTRHQTVATFEQKFPSFVTFNEKSGVTGTILSAKTINIDSGSGAVQQDGTNATVERSSTCGGSINLTRPRGTLASREFGRTSISGDNDSRQIITKRIEGGNGFLGEVDKSDLDGNENRQSTKVITTVVETKRDQFGHVTEHVTENVVVDGFTVSTSEHDEEF